MCLRRPGPGRSARSSEARTLADRGQAGPSEQIRVDSWAGGPGSAVLCAGAHGATMSSNYNIRPRVPEVMVDGDRGQLVRGRETLEDLMRGEQVGPE